MLVECGFVRAMASDGAEYTFTPSLGRIAALGSPHEIVALFAALHGPRAAQEAAYVLAGLCDQEDPAPLIGALEPGGTPEAPDALQLVPGEMPPAEMVLIARHLMQHGIVGSAKPGQGGGAYVDRFDAAEYIAAARVHLGLSSADAEALSMTEFQQMLRMKYPDIDKQSAARDLPSREEYEAHMKAFEELRRG